MTERPMPSDTRAEAGVIGNCLRDMALAPQLYWLPQDAFTDPGYRLAWHAIRELAAEQEPTDQVFVLQRMERIDYEAAIDHSHRVMQTVTNDDVLLLSSYGIKYAEQVMEKHQLRELITAARHIAKAAYDDADPQIVATVAMQRLARVLSMSPDSQSGRRTYGQVLDALHEDALDRAELRGQVGLKTGFGAIDRLSAGFEPGDLILVAARPGAGKSALGLSLARRIAGRFHHQGSGAVDVVTMEMSVLAQARRLIASRTGLDTRLIRQGFHHTPDRFDEAAYTAFSRNLEADRAEVGDHLAFHDGVITTDQLAILATDAKTNHDLRILIIDQLDLFGDTSKEGETARIGEISKKLKQLARRLGIVIICLVQLNRESEKRNDHRPQLSDLRQSGRLEQDADVVLGIYRPSYYHPSDPTNRAYAEWSELLVMKFRDGKSGMFVPLRFIEDAASYTDWDEHAHPIGDMVRLVKKTETER